VTPSGTPQDFVTTPLKAPFSSFSATDAQVSHSGSQTVRPRSGYAEHVVATAAGDDGSVYGRDDRHWVTSGVVGLHVPRHRYRGGHGIG
jgi:hypothetical protein